MFNDLHLVADNFVGLIAVDIWYPAYCYISNILFCLVGANLLELGFRYGFQGFLSASCMTDCKLLFDCSFRLWFLAVIHPLESLLFELKRWKCIRNLRVLHLKLCFL